MIDDNRLTIKICNSQPVELTDLSNSFSSFADEYKRHISQEGTVTIPEEMNLYVKEIKTGSIVADLIALAPYVLPFIENSKTILSFMEYLKTAYDYLIGRQTEKPPLTKANYENLIGIVNPIAKDKSSQLNIQNTINGNVSVNINLNSIEANAAQNAAYRDIEALTVPIIGLREKVLLYWYQARNDPKSKTGDKAIVESVYSGPVKAAFDNEHLKESMLLDSQNPFNLAYLVDLTVETIQGKPVIYKIVKMHENFSKPTDVVEM